MSTRQIIAAVASVAILGSTIAIFQTSSHPRHYAAGPAPVHSLETVVVNANPLPADAEAGVFLGAQAPSAHTGLALPGLHNASLKIGTPLFMPYYSFANDLHTIIKD